MLAAIEYSCCAEQLFVAFLKAVKLRNRIPYKVNVRKYAHNAKTYYGKVRG